MKKLVTLLLCVCMLLVACGRSKVIDGVERTPVGLLSNAVEPNLFSQNYSKQVHYEICWGNVFWGVLFSEIIIVPILVFGFSMYNPVSSIDTTSNK